MQLTQIMHQTELYFKALKMSLSEIHFVVNEKW